MPIFLQELPSESSLLDKAGIFDFSPFEETLFLDLDTVVLTSIEHGFEHARRHGIACCINENPYARRHVGLKAETDLIEYNTGVLFFTREAAPFFNLWKNLVAQIDSRVAFQHLGKTRLQPCNDQGSFAKAADVIACESARFPFVLPLNWNFRPKWHRVFFGEVKIWHDRQDVPESLIEWNRDQAQLNAVVCGTILTSPEKSSPATASSPD